MILILQKSQTAKPFERGRQQAIIQNRHVKVSQWSVLPRFDYELLPNVTLRLVRPGDREVRRLSLVRSTPRWLPCLAGSERADNITSCSASGTFLSSTPRAVRGRCGIPSVPVETFSTVSTGTAGDGGLDGDRRFSFLVSENTGLTSFIDCECRRSGAPFPLLLSFTDKRGFAVERARRSRDRAE